MNFLRYDSPFMIKIRMLVDYILLGLLWLVASLPVVTFGAATTAAFFAAEKSIQKDNGKMFLTFWSCFLKEFKQATILWLIEMALIAIWGVNVVLLRTIEINNAIYALLLMVLLIEFGWMQFWFAYLSRFRDTTMVLLGNTFRVAIGNFPFTLLLIFISIISVAGLIIAILYVTPFPLFIPGVYLFLTCNIYRKIFKEYFPPDTE